jgi:acyl-CoA dehydrogenase
MDDPDRLNSATAFPGDLLGEIPDPHTLAAYDRDWFDHGRSISAAVDRGGTPWLRLFDDEGRRIDEIAYPPEYWTLLRSGYRAGIIARVFEHHSILPFYRLGYVTSFHDPGLYCPYTVSLATAVALHKYGSESLQQRFLPPLLRTDDRVWQGATWMTEIRGGSDLGANVDTSAREHDGRWLLTGDKYFASNVGAELAVVAARPEGAPSTVRGLALFLLPRRRDGGELNYTVRRLKDKIATRSVPTGEVELRDSEAYLLGDAQQGIYLIMEVLNVSRVANSIASVALAQRAIADAAAFARKHQAFGRPIIEQPLLARQFQQRESELRKALALAAEAARLLDEVWLQKPPYDDRYHLFRLVAHLAKYWTAEFAVQTCKWAMEVHGGLGVLAEFAVERWFREAMILSIWEGTAHRQMLDGLEVMQHKSAHKMLLDSLRDRADGKILAQLESAIELHLSLPQENQEAGAEALFHELAGFTARTLARD